MDFSLLETSKRVAKSQVRGVKTPSSSVLNPKTPSRPYCSVNDSPQDVFKTLFRDPKPASWIHLQALVKDNHFGTALERLVYQFGPTLPPSFGSTVAEVAKHEDMRNAPNVAARNRRKNDGGPSRKFMPCALPSKR